MNQGRALAWSFIVLAALLVGFLLGRLSAPDATAPTTQLIPDGTPPEAVAESAAPTPTPAPTQSGPPTDVSTGDTATPPPTPTPAPTATDEATPAEDVYVVQPGDTLTGIAEEVYGDPFCFDELAAANTLDPAAGLLIGMELTLPPLDDCGG